MHTHVGVELMGISGRKRLGGPSHRGGDTGDGRRERVSPAASGTALDVQKSIWALIFTNRGCKTLFGRSQVVVVGTKVWL